VQLDFQTRELTVKLVYYGPALSGKTTNLQSIHQLVSGESRGRLMTLETRDDRTLFFDLLPLVFQAEGGLQLRLKLFTVPGQVIHDATRRLVLQGADGVAFIADSQLEETRANAAAYANLRQNLVGAGFDPTQMPIVIQFNKRDLPNIRPDAEIDSLAVVSKEPVFKAVASRGLGVIETFLGLVELTWERLEREHKLAEKFQLDRRQVLRAMRAKFGVPRETRP
jgi:mutual gliding-motility protein MglA